MNTVVENTRKSYTPLGLERGSSGQYCGRTRSWKQNTTTTGRETPIDVSSFSLQRRKLYLFIITTSELVRELNRLDFVGVDPFPSEVEGDAAHENGQQRGRAHSTTGFQRLTTERAVLQ